MSTMMERMDELQASLLELRSWTAQADDDIRALRVELADAMHEFNARHAGVSADTLTETPIDARPSTYSTENSIDFVRSCHNCQGQCKTGAV